MRLTVWKVLGLAGAAGVAATGVAIARDQRQRVRLEPDEVRERLQQRLRQLSGEADAETSSEPGRGSS